MRGSGAYQLLSSAAPKIPSAAPQALTADRFLIAKRLLLILQGRGTDLSSAGPRPHQREQAAKELAGFLVYPEILTTLSGLLEPRYDHQTRLFAMWALNGVTDSSIRAQLLQVSLDPKLAFELRERALRSLGNVRSREEQQALISLMLNLLEELPLKELAAHALSGTIHEDQMIQPLARAIASNQLLFESMRLSTSLQHATRSQRLLLQSTLARPLVRASCTRILERTRLIIVHALSGTNHLLGLEALSHAAANPVNHTEIRTHALLSIIASSSPAAITFLIDSLRAPASHGLAITFLNEKAIWLTLNTTLQTALRELARPSDRTNAKARELSRSAGTALERLEKRQQRHAGKLLG